MRCLRRLLYLCLVLASIAMLFEMTTRLGRRAFDALSATPPP